MIVLGQAGRRKLMDVLWGRGGRIELRLGYGYLEASNCHWRGGGGCEQGDHIPILMPADLSEFRLRGLCSSIVPPQTKPCVVVRVKLLRWPEVALEDLA